MQTRRIALPASHPAFDGHFPGQPLLPGVVLLAEALEALVMGRAMDAPCTISSIKFLAPVRPGDALELRHGDALELRQGDALELRQGAASAKARLSFELWRHAPGDPPQGALAAVGQLEAAS